MITKVNDLRSAGSRARAIKDHLKDDLGQLDSDLKKQQAARQEQVKLRDQKVADLAKLQVLQAKQIQAQSDLATQIAATRYELSRLDGQSAALAQQIADLLQQQEAGIIAAAESAVRLLVELGGEGALGEPVLTTVAARNFTVKLGGPVLELRQIGGGIPGQRAGVPSEIRRQGRLRRR